MTALINAFEDYIVIEGNSAEVLRRQVLARMTEGYLPLGGVSASLSESDDYRYTLYCQAMLKPIIRQQPEEQRPT